MADYHLESIENDRKITLKANREFLYCFQNALLAALTESGRLTEEQYRYAEEKLRRQTDDFTN